MDAELALRFGEGRSAGEVLAEVGEPAFRMFEWRTLGALLRAEPDDSGAPILATGGGAVTCALSRELLGRRTIGVYLRASPRILRQRASGDETLRPTLTAGGVALDLERQATLRDALYRSLATLVLETDDRTPNEIGRTIEVELRRRLLS